MDGNGQPSNWSVKKSQKLYQIKGWGEPYFKINSRGNVEVRPDPTQDRGIDLFDLAMQLGERGLDMPLLIRFPNIIQDRIIRSRLAGDPPDFSIRPKLAGIGLSDFHKADEAIELCLKQAEVLSEGWSS